EAAATGPGAPFAAAGARAFTEGLAGRGAARIRRRFKAGRKKAPAIVFIDELDAVGTARSGHSLRLWPLRAVPTASSSSMKTIAGAFLRPALNRRRIRAAPRPASPSVNARAPAAANGAPGPVAAAS